MVMMSQVYITVVLPGQCALHPGEPEFSRGKVPGLQRNSQSPSPQAGSEGPTLRIFQKVYLTGAQKITILVPL